MFYAIRREVLVAVGGFEAIEYIFAEDFAIAQLICAHGYRLAQTPPLSGHQHSGQGTAPWLQLCHLCPLQQAVSARSFDVAWWVPVMQLVFPFQLLVALLSPQRINWRGNIVQVERGSFRYVRRRTEETDLKDT
jgi:hypothetical protein